MWRRKEIHQKEEKEKKKLKEKKNKKKRKEMRGGKNGGKDNFQRLELKPEVGFFFFFFFKNLFASCDFKSLLILGMGRNRLC